MLSPMADDRVAAKMAAGRATRAFPAAVFFAFAFPLPFGFCVLSRGDLSRGEFFGDEVGDAGGVLRPLSCRFELL